VETGKREGTYRPQAVWLYSDGMFHWIYEKDLYKNRFETNYVLRITILVFVLSWLLMMGVLLGVGVDPEDGLPAFGIITAVCLGGGLLTVGIVRLAHLSSARHRNGVEVIAFGMNDDGLRQFHYDDARKAEDAVERMLLAASATQGAGLMKAGGLGVTLFRDVRRMGLHPKDDLIDLTLKGNDKCRVYVGPEDFGFVRDYIRQHIREGR
jgi:hypothetical protein